MASMEMDRADQETLVDLYAMAALQGLLSSAANQNAKEHTCALAWQFAEEMFRVRDTHIGRISFHDSVAEARDE